MSWRHSSLIVLVLVALLVAACGPLPTDSAAPTEPGASAEPGSATQAPAGTDTSAPAFGDTPAPATSGPAGAAAGEGELVDPNDYHALGAPDAPVTIIEYSDFQ